jgi:hypothetical protein
MASRVAPTPAWTSGDKKSLAEAVTSLFNVRHSFTQTFTHYVSDSCDFYSSRLLLSLIFILFFDEQRNELVQEGSRMIEVLFDMVNYQYEPLVAQTLQFLFRFD